MEVVLEVYLLIIFSSANQNFRIFKRLKLQDNLFLHFFGKFKMVEELITNKKTAEELSLLIIDNGCEGDDSGGTVDCVIEIKRKRIVSKTAKKIAK